MKAPSKTKRMKKYMILFSVVLFIVVLSTGLAFYVGTKDVMEDIRDKVGAEIQNRPAVQSTIKEMQIALEPVKKSLNNIAGGQDAIEKGNHYVSSNNSWIDCSQEYSIQLVIIPYTHKLNICIF